MSFRTLLAAATFFATSAFAQQPYQVLNPPQPT